MPQNSYNFFQLQREALAITYLEEQRDYVDYELRISIV